MRIYVSPTKLNLHKECARCWYDDNKRLTGIARPRSPFPSLPNGIDATMKAYMDSYRGSLPPELAHLTDHRLMDEQSVINQYRGWNGLTATRNVTVDRPTTNIPTRKVTHTIITSGGIDDLLYHNTDMIDEDGNPVPEVVVLDVKTKDKEPDEDYGEKYYTTQINTYGYLLKENGYQVADYALLWYWWPLGVGNGGNMEFGQKLLKMPMNIKETVRQLDEIGSKLPTVSSESMVFRRESKSAPECGHCDYITKKNGADEDGKTADEIIEELRAKAEGFGLRVVA